MRVASSARAPRILTNFTRRVRGARFWPIMFQRSVLWECEAHQSIAFVITFRLIPDLLRNDDCGEHRLSTADLARTRRENYANTGSVAG